MPESLKDRAAQPETGNGRVRFGAFEVDLRSGELRKAGTRIKLQEQPFRILEILLERQGELVTREELRSRIWPDDSYGDFDHAVNVAVAKLRTALGDSADSPSYIETVPRRGYRFVADLDESANLHAIESVSAPVVAPTAPNRLKGRRVVLVMFGIIAAATLLLWAGVTLGRRSAPQSVADFHRLTVRHGTVFNARFAPDGHNIIYSAAWDGAPVEIFETDENFSGTRSLGLTGTGLLAVSPTGELAVIDSAKPRFMLTLRGTLGQVPMSGGSPRPVAEKVEWADWAQDGKRMAIVREVGGWERLEFPIGQVVYQTTGWISHPRISPDGAHIAFLEHPTGMDDRGFVSVVDLAGHRSVLSTGWESEEGLAWAPDGNEVLFSATQAGLGRRIYAVNMAGHVRLRYSAPGGITLEDVAPDGRMLITRDEPRAGIMGLPPGSTQEKNLSWLDWSLPVDLSPDGKHLLFDEQGEEGGPAYTVATRDTDGSQPVPLGEGMAGSFSPDGKWVTATVDYSQIVLLPTGAGTAKHLDPGGIQQYGHPVQWMPNGKQLIFSGQEPGHISRCFIQNVDGGKPRPITPEGVSMCRISPDGKWIAADDTVAGLGHLYPTDGGAPRDISGMQPGESFSWSADPRYVYVGNQMKVPVKVYRLNIDTGKREFVKELNPPDLAGVCELRMIMFSADGRSYIYGYTRLLSDLYLVKGLK